MIIQRAPWSETDLARLLAGGAGERVAFAPGRIAPAKLAEMMVALANSHGGAILLGVSPNGRVAGLDDPETVRRAAQEAQLLATPPLILPLPQCIDHEGKQICLVEVPPGLPYAYNLDGRYLTRTGATNRLLSTAELRGLLLQRGEAGFESRPVPGATLDDLDPAQVAAYAQAVPGLAGEAPERMLLSRGCLVGEAGGETAAPTYAGILLFGREPQRFVRGAELLLVRYAGPVMGDEFVRHDAAGTLPDQIRQAEAFVLANMRRGMSLKGFTREEITEYPLPVVREAIVNAVAHRDYVIRGDGIRVLMFSDHMEIYSPGRLPGHVTLENLLHERFSRTEAIVQVLSDLGFVERLGYGIDRMVSEMTEAGLPAPRFEETAAGFRVILQGRGDELVSKAPAAAAIPGGLRWGNRRLTERQEAALAYVAEHGSITNREFHDLFPDVSDETIRRDLADLVDQGLMMKVGERKSTYYILK